MRATLHAQDDDALLAQLRAGDELAFGALVDRHRPWLVRLCTRLLGYDAHSAEDAAQESLLKLHAAARRDGRPLRVRPWLTVVARNTCVDHQRRRRFDLPGELPERAAPGDASFGDDLSAADAVLTEAWHRLSGRHREVLYLREVLGFSYKEIGAVMDLSMAATETLVFRARAALRREYERCGGSAVGYGVLAFRLARLRLGRRRGDVSVADGLSRAGLNDGTVSLFGNLGDLGGRLAQWMSALPGCGEQAVTRALSLAAGVMVAAASLLPGLGSLAGGPAAAAFAGAGPAAVAAPATTLKALLGDAVPADWEPHRTRSAAQSSPIASPSSGGVGGAGLPAFPPLRDAATAARTGDRPTLRRGEQADGGGGRLRSVLARSPSTDGSQPPAHPLRSLLTDPPAVPIGPPPVDPPPVDPVALPAEPLPTDPPLPVPPAPEAPSISGSGTMVKGLLPLG